VAHDRFQTPEADALRQHQRDIRGVHLRDALADPARPAAMTRAAGPLTVDFSRMLGQPRTLDLLADLAVSLGVPSQVQAMATGAEVNPTARRSAHCTARRPRAPDHGRR
jgi:hypothetical protein